MSLNLQQQLPHILALEQHQQHLGKPLQSFYDLLARLQLARLHPARHLAYRLAVALFVVEHQHALYARPVHQQRQIICRAFDSCRAVVLRDGAADYNSGPEINQRQNGVQDFTADVKQLSSGIAGLQIGGGTAIWDAISFACWKLAAYPEKERVAKVLVVLTDGEDNLSRISLKKAIQDAENTGVSVYAISTKDFSELGKYGNPISDADKVLQALTERTGGEAMFPSDLKTLNKTFDRPADFQNDGHYRRIKIVATKNGRSLKVHARQGYYAPLDAKVGS